MSLRKTPKPAGSPAHMSYTQHTWQCRLSQYIALAAQVGTTPNSCTLL